MIIVSKESKSSAKLPRWQCSLGESSRCSGMHIVIAGSEITGI